MLEPKCRNQGANLGPNAYAFGRIATAGAWALNEAPLCGLNFFPNLVDRLDFRHPNREFERKFSIGASLVCHFGDNFYSDDHTVVFLERPENATELLGVVGVTSPRACFSSTS